MVLLYSFFHLLLSLYTYTGTTTTEPSLCRAPEKSSETLFRSLDGGRTWVDLSRDLPSGASPLFFSATGDNYWLGTNKGLYSGYNMVSKLNWDITALTENGIYGICESAAGPILLAQWRGIFRLNMGGIVTQLQPRLPDDNINMALETKNGDLLVACGSGLYRLAKKGTAWEHVNGPGNVYSVVESGSALVSVGEYGLSRSTDGGATWKNIFMGTNKAFNIAKGDHGIFAIFDGEEFMGCSAPNELYFSGDDGATWKPYGSKWPSGLNKAYDVIQAGNDIYVCGEKCLYRSSDQGRTWEKIEGLPSKEGMFWQLAVRDNEVYVFAMQGC